MKNLFLVVLGLAFLALLWALLRRMTTVTARPPTAAQVLANAAKKYAEHVGLQAGTFVDSGSVDFMNYLAEYDPETYAALQANKSVWHT
jgi:hypothetical protein